MKLKIYLFNICLFVNLACTKKADDPEPALISDPMEESIKKGMTAFYSFSNNWNDESGNNYHALVKTGKLADDRKGKASSALAFGDTDTSPSEVPGNLLKKGASYCFWMYKADTQKQFSIWNNTFTRSEKIGGVSKDATYGIKIYSSGMDANLTIEYKIGLSSGLNIKVPYTHNQWNFYVVSVIEGTISYPFPTFKIYRNGLLIYKQDVDSFSINAVETSVSNRFGGDPMNMSTKAIEGKIDDIGIWSRLLTDDEIVYMYLKK